MLVVPIVRVVQIFHQQFQYLLVISNLGGSYRISKGKEVL